MTRLRTIRRRLRSDRSGIVGPTIAALATSLLAAGGLALDVGLYYMGNRDLRSATEAAALAAAMNPLDAHSRAINFLAKNGYPASVLKSVEVGYYCASMWRATGNRFVTGAAAVAECPGSSVQNAVRITTGRNSRRFLTGVMGGASPIPNLAATASAARIDEAGVSVTSGHLTVTNTLLNSVNNLLGALLGVKLTLSTVQIEALMGGNVDAGKFFDALARRGGQTGTYHEVVQGTYGIGTIAQAAADAAYDPAAAAALRVVATAAGNGYKVPLAGMFGLGVWKNMPVGESHAPPAAPALNAGLNAYQLITYAAQAGPGVVDASDLVNLLVPSKPGSTVKIVAVASDAGARPRFAFGPAGETSAGTSMIRLQIEVSAVAAAALPLIVDVAAADASITAIDCANRSELSAHTRVDVASRSGLVNIYLGRLLRSDGMSKALPTLEKSDFDFVPLVDLRPLAWINAKAVVKPVVGQTNASAVFGPGGSGLIASSQSAGRPVTIGNPAQVGNTLSSLGSFLGGRNGGLQVCLILTGCILDTSDNALLGAVGGVVSGLGQVLNSTTDPLLDNVLAALGVQLGHASIWVTGARCGVPVLI